MHGSAARRHIEHGGLCAALLAGEAAHSGVMGDPTRATLHAEQQGALSMSCARSVRDPAGAAVAQLRQSHSWPCVKARGVQTRIRSPSVKLASSPGHS